jgi:phage shock protein A
VGLIERIRNAVRTNLAEIADRFDNPDERLSQFIQRIEGDLGDARMELGAAAREEKRITRERDGATAEIQSMRDRARLALAKADEDLAREALRRSEHARERSERLGRDLELQRDATRLFREHVGALELKLAEARERLEVLRARQRLAEAQRSMARRIGGAEEGISGTLQYQIDELEAEARAHHELFGSTADALDEEDRLEQLLDELRAEGRGKPAPPAGEGEEA